MRSTRVAALAALLALPLTATVAGAAPAAANMGSALSKVDAGRPVIQIHKGGGHGHGGHGHGGHGHGGHFHGHGGGHWHGGGGNHHHHHFRPRFYGGPYYYYDYGPSYYDDGYYEDDDEAYVYADEGDAVARCEARYRSFDRRSGTFLANDGRRKLCPYLR